LEIQGGDGRNNCFTPIKNNNVVLFDNAVIQKNIPKLCQDLPDVVLVLIILLFG